MSSTPKKKNVVEYYSCVSSENYSVYENEESAKKVPASKKSKSLNLNNPPRKRRNTRANNVEINPEGNKGISNAKKKRHKTESINPIPNKSKSRLCSKCKTSKNDPLVVYETKDNKNQNDKHREDKVSKEQSISHLSHLNICYDCVFKFHD